MLREVGKKFQKVRRENGIVVANLRCRLDHNSLEAFLLLWTEAGRDIGGPDHDHHGSDRATIMKSVGNYDG